MRNPWEEIDLKDYESHMSLESVYQLQVLNEMMREQFDSYDVKTVMVLGVAGGNGIEHIDTEKVDKVYGVDVNERFLAECRKRYTEYSDVFETICANLLSEDLQLPCVKFVIANLLIEYIGYECFQRVINQVKPQYISCIIQINTGDTFVSDSPYLHAFDGLDEVHHQMEEEALVNCMKAIGYKLKEAKERELPNGKKFVRLDFQEMIVEKVFDELTDKYGEDFNWQITTKNLLLVPLGTKYLESTHEYASDVENTCYMVHMPKRDLNETREFLESIDVEWKKSDPSFYEFAILLEENHIGAVSLYLNQERNTAEIGWIISKNYWGKGYATEAADGLIQYSRQVMGISCFVAHCDSENIASEKVMRKLNFVQIDEYGGRKNRISDEERMEKKFELV